MTDDICSPASYALERFTYERYGGGMDCACIYIHIDIQHRWDKLPRAQVPLLIPRIIGFEMAAMLVAS